LPIEFIVVCTAVFLALESEGMNNQSMKPGIAATVAITTPAILATTATLNQKTF